MEDRSLQDLQQVLGEGQGQHLVGGEGHVPEAEALQEAVVDPAVALLAHHREAGVHERVQVAVHRAAHHAQILGQLLEPDADAAARQALDQLPLPCQLVAAHG